MKKTSTSAQSWGEIGKAVGAKMEQECKGGNCKPWWNKERAAGHGGGGALYGLGFIGALVYFVSTATGILMMLLGVLKAIVWPAYLVYGLLKFLGM